MKNIADIQMYRFWASISKLKKSHQIREKAFVYNICSNTTEYFNVPYFLTREVKILHAINQNFG